MTTDSCGSWPLPHICGALYLYATRGRTRPTSVQPIPDCPPPTEAPAIQGPVYSGQKAPLLIEPNARESSWRSYWLHAQRAGPAPALLLTEAVVAAEGGSASCQVGPRGSLPSMMASATTSCMLCSWQASRRWSHEGGGYSSPPTPSKALARMPAAATAAEATAAEAAAAAAAAAAALLSARISDTTNDGRGGNF